MADDVKPNLRRGSFPRGFSAVGWILLGGWICFASILIAVNSGIQMATPWKWVFYCSSVMSLWAVPVWLLFGFWFAFSARFRKGIKTEWIQIALLLAATISYLVVSAMVD